VASSQLPTLVAPQLSCFIHHKVSDLHLYYTARAMKCIIIVLLMECIAYSIVLGSGWTSQVSIGAERAVRGRSWLELRGGAGDDFLRSNAVGLSSPLIRMHCLDIC
jgi:hypothetical protein